MSDSANPRFKEAVYKDPGLPEYAENPLIAALPYIMSPKKAANELATLPRFQAEEINLSGEIRVHAISRLTRQFFVPQTTHLVLEQKISQLIRKSYLGRNPDTANFKRKLNVIRETIASQDLTTYVHDVVNSPASSMAVMGISGVGKSTATNLILDTYERVIYHPKYHILQVPWLKIDCPYDGSLSEFCESFFIALDKRLNTKYRQKYTSGRPSIGKMIADVASLCLIHAIGLLVIDEFQHMNLAKSGGEKKMINFLVTLVNVVEVSIMLIGTPKALSLFTKEFRQARRASGEGSIVWDRMELDDNWDAFLDTLWPYQWLKNPVKRSELLTNCLYELSQGIPDIVVKLFCLSQARAILLASNPEEECLSTDLFSDVFEEEFSVVKPLLDALRKGDDKILRECSDLVIPKIESSLLDSFAHLRPKALTKKRIETGEPSQNDVANSARDTLVSMGIGEDIANPMIEDLCSANPDVTLIEIIQKVTTTLSGLDTKPRARKKTKSSVVTKVENWPQLQDEDLRKIYADKSESMYDAMRERGLIYSIEDILAG